MMKKFDEEIQEIEARLAREREALVHQAEDLGHTARDAAVSAKGLIAAAALGFMIGEFTRPPRHHHAAPAASPRKLGLGGLLAGAALAVVKAKYGSPASLSRIAWDFAAEQRARRTAATTAASPTTGSAAPSSSAATTGFTATTGSAATTAPVRPLETSQPLP